MARNENQPRQLVWVVDHDVATIDQVLALAHAVKRGDVAGSAATVTVTLAGSMDGVSYSGDLEQVASELSSESELQFVNAGFQAQFPSNGSAQVNFSLSFPIRQVGVNIQNATSEFATELFTLTQSKFPPTPGPSNREADSLSLRLVRLISEAENAKTVVAEAEKGRRAVEAAELRATKIMTALDTRVSEATTAAQESTQHNEKSATNAAEISNAKAQALADQQSISTALSTVSSLESKIQQFFGEIDKYQAQLIATDTKAKETVEQNATASRTVIEQNEKLQEQIREHLQKAVGASLFSAFKIRKSQLSLAKWVWAVFVVIAIIAQVAVFIWLAEHLTAEMSKLPFYQRPGFVLRALASVPIIFFIGYSIRQYARERDFEELYAFKSALSFSLAPYLDLVKTVGEKQESNEYRDFVVKTIGQIFENPSADDRDSPRRHRKDSLLARDILDGLVNLVEKVKK